MTGGMNGSISSEAEEASTESLGNAPYFGNSNQNTQSNPSPSTEKSDADSVSNYDGSYFMNMPTNNDEEPQSFDYIQNWTESNQNLSKESEAAPEDQSAENGTVDGGSWYGGNGAPKSTSEQSTNPFARRSSFMNKGASYLENLSKSDSPSSSNGVNGGDSYAGGTPQQEEVAQQEVPSQSGSTYPERIKAAYRDWCQYYGKEYNENRLATFSSNFLAVERYHRETGVSLILNELADMTSEEFQQNKN